MALINNITHCRLCGVLKPSNTLLHLSWDKKSRDEVVQKLLRINACEKDMFANDTLPKTVCYLCMNSLSNAFEFVESIKNAQTVLNEVYSKSVRENNYCKDKGVMIDNNNVQKNISKEVQETMKESNEDENYMKIDLISPEDLNIKVEISDPLDTDMNVKTTDTNTSVNATNLNEQVVNLQDPNFYLLLQPSVVYGYVGPEGTKAPVPLSCTDTNANKPEINDKEELPKKNHDDAKDTGLNELDYKTESNTQIKNEIEGKVDGIVIESDCTPSIETKSEDTKKSTVKIKISIPIKKKKTKKDDGREREPKYKTKSKRSTTEVSLKRATWKDYEWKCAFCNGLYSNSDEMTSHLIKIHGWCNIYSCTDCTKKNYRLDKFIYHVKRHRHDLKYSCYKCYKQFASMMQCRTHTLEHSKAEFVCPGCSTIFNSAGELNKHTLIYYKGVASYDWRSDDPRNLFSCSKCDKTFNRKCDFVKHLARHQKKRTHICDKCGAGFLGQGPLNNHMANHSDLRPFKCEVCGSYFKTPTQLRSHVMTHEDKELFICDDCGKGFNIKRKLVGHITRMHMDILIQFSCEYCEKKFNDKRGLKRHLHLHTGDMPYSCQFCPKKFRDRGNYSKHLKRIHDKLLAKKTYTQKGSFPIDPLTGEAIFPNANLVEAWKDKILSKRVPKGPKRKSKKSQ